MENPLATILQSVPLGATIAFFVLLVADFGRRGFRKWLDAEILWALVAAAFLLLFQIVASRAEPVRLHALLWALSAFALMYYAAAWGREHWLEAGAWDVPLDLRWREWKTGLPLAIAGAVLAAGYSILVFRSGSIALGSWRDGAAWRPIVVLGLGALGRATAEEVVAQYYVQGYLTHLLTGIRGKRHVACLLTAAAFTALHSEPEHQLLRWLQVFPLGLLFGYLFLRGGLLWSASAHWLTNVLLYSYLIFRSMP